jgi:hypothetical protein
MGSLFCQPAWVLAIVFTGSAWFSVGQANDPKAARAVIEKAIKALGDADRQAKFVATMWKEKGTFHRGGQEYRLYGRICNAATG